MGFLHGPLCSDLPPKLLPALPVILDFSIEDYGWSIQNTQPKSPVLPAGIRPPRPRGPRSYVPPGAPQPQVEYSPTFGTPPLSSPDNGLLDAHVGLKSKEYSVEVLTRQVPWQAGHRRRPSTPVSSPLTPLTLNTMNTSRPHDAGPIILAEAIHDAPRFPVFEDLPTACTPEHLLPSPLPVKPQGYHPSVPKRSVPSTRWVDAQTRSSLTPICPTGDPARRQKQQVMSKSTYRMPPKAAAPDSRHTIVKAQRQAVKLQEAIARGGGRGDAEDGTEGGEVSLTAGQNRKRVWLGPWYAGRVVGAGISGSVAVSRDWQTGQVAANKVLAMFNIDQIDDPIPAPSVDSQYHGVVTNKGLDALEKEIAAMKLVSHENIIRMWDSFEDPSNLYLLLEYVQGGELFDLLVARGRFGPDEGSYLFQQIAAAVGHLHKLNIVHRDLKPENILVTRSYRIKLADFGMVAFRSGDWKMETACGSPHYAAPEVMAPHDYVGPSADIWSLGVLLYAIVVGRLPFDDQHGDFRVLVNLVEAAEYHMPEALVPDVKDLIWRILVKEPAYRLKMNAIVAHPFCQRQFKVTRERSIQLEKDMGLEPLKQLDVDVDDGTLATVIAATSALSTSKQIEQSIQSSQPTWEKQVHDMLAHPRSIGGLEKHTGKFELVGCDTRDAIEESSFDNVAAWLFQPADPGPLHCDIPSRVPQHRPSQRHASAGKGIGAFRFVHTNRSTRKTRRIPAWVAVVEGYRALDFCNVASLPTIPVRQDTRRDQKRVRERIALLSHRKILHLPSRESPRSRDHPVAKRAATPLRRVALRNRDLPPWAFDFLLWQEFTWQAYGPTCSPNNATLLSGESRDCDPEIGQRWIGQPTDWVGNPYYRPSDLHDRRKRVNPLEGFEGTILSGRDEPFGGESHLRQEAAMPEVDVPIVERPSAVTTVFDVARGDPLWAARQPKRRRPPGPAFFSYGEHSEDASGLSKYSSTSTSSTASSIPSHTDVLFDDSFRRPPCPPAPSTMSRGPLPTPPPPLTIDLEWNAWRAIEQLMPPASPLPLLDAFGTPQQEETAHVNSPWSPAIRHSRGTTPNPASERYTASPGPASISQIPAVQPRRSPALISSTPKQTAPTVETPHTAHLSPGGPIGTPRQPVYPAVHRSRHATPLVHPTPRRAYERVPAVPLGGREPGERRTLVERPSQASPASHCGFVPPPPSHMMGGNRQQRPPPLPLTQLSPDPTTPSMLVWSPSDTPNLSTLVTPVLGYSMTRASTVVLQEVPGAVPQRGWFDKALGTSPLYFEFVAPQDCTGARAECTRLLRSLGAVVQMEDAEGWGHLKVSVSEVRDVTGIVIKKSARLKLGFIPKQQRPSASSGASAMASPRSTGSASAGGLHSVITMLHERGSTDAFLAVYSRLKTDYGQSGKRASMGILPQTFAASKSGGGPPNGLGMPEIAYLNQELQEHQDVMIRELDPGGFRPS